MDKVIDDAKKGASEIKEIVFVGGSTGIHKIKEIINNYFFDVNINDSINPDEAVAYGATIQPPKIIKQGTDILNDVILTDITPFSLGTKVINDVVSQIENMYEIDKEDINEGSENTLEETQNLEITDDNITISNITNVNNMDEEQINLLLEKYNEGLEKGDIMDVIIPRGSKIPIKVVKNYITIDDYQEKIRISVFEGENKYVKDNHLLGKFVLYDLPKKLQNEVSISVTFDIDVNGILTVTAIEKSKGIKKSIKIINDRGFNEDEIIQ